MNEPKFSVGEEVVTGRRWESIKTNVIGSYRKSELSDDGTIRMVWMYSLTGINALVHEDDLSRARDVVSFEQGEV